MSEMKENEVGKESGVSEEVRDPQALLAAYNKLKADISQLAEERESLKKQVEGLSSDEFRLRALVAETKIALQNQGIKDVERVLPYVGTDGLDFDDEGNVTGLDERLGKLKEDLPEVFDPKLRSGGKADIYAQTSPDIKTDPFREAVSRALKNG